MKDTSALLRSTTGQSALNGALVSAPSLPKPVVEGDLAGEAADEIHEELGQFLVVDRVVDGERRDAGLEVGRIVAAAGEDGVHGQIDGAIGGDIAGEPRGHFGEVQVARIDEIGAALQVARIVGGRCR